MTVYSIQEATAWTDLPPQPFELDTGEQHITIESVLRFLPGKRLVARARINDQTVLAKCFWDLQPSDTASGKQPGWKALPKQVLIPPL